MYLAEFLRLVMAIDTILREAYRAVTGKACRFRSVEFPEEIIDIPDADIVLSKLGFKWGDLSDSRSLVFLCRLVAGGYVPVFEIGTFRGRTTYNLAANLRCEDAFVATLDGELDDSAANVDGHVYPQHLSGELVLGAAPEIQKRVRLLRGDSRGFDYSPYEGRCGLVFVDGGHSCEVVKHDSEVAFRLLKSSGGLIVWDDYGTYWPGVKKALDELANSRPLVYVRSANVVICRVGSPKDVGGVPANPKCSWQCR